MHSKITVLSICSQQNVCTGSYNILNDLSNRICVPNKTEDLNLKVFSMIAEIIKQVWVDSRWH